MMYRVTAAVFFGIALYVIVAALGAGGSGRSGGLFGAVALGWVGAWLWGKASGKTAQDTFGKAIEIKHGQKNDDDEAGQAIEGPVPGVVAHRGFAAEWPENTVPAMEAAVEAGAFFLECDIQLSRDGVPFVLHDPDLMRISGRQGVAAELDATQLATFPATEPARLGDRYTDIRLQPLADLAARLAEWPGVTLFVELKEESMRAFGVAPMVSAVLDAIRPVLDQCVIISFDDEAVAEASRQGAPQVGWVIREWSVATRVRCEILGVRYIFVDDNIVPEDETFWTAEGSEGWRFVVYEITEPARALALAARGAQMIETFEVGTMLDALGPATTIEA